MNHTELLNTYAVVSIQTACAILGGEGDPVSSNTVYRLIRSGDLEKRTKGKVTTASIRRYLEEGPLCHGASGGGGERGASTGLRVSGSRRGSARPSKANDDLNAASSTVGWERLIRYPGGRKSD